jgi:LytS/YehU family sensor histidine kinase
MWFYAVVAGISYAVQTRNRLHEQEAHAAHAEALASRARLDAIQARLNPHFLFNALHTLAALSKFRPAAAEGAIERLGDMLRYTLQENARELVEFSEEYDFTKKYLDFEQLRYEDRLKINLEIDPTSFDFELPPFSIQTLAENAVHHAIAVRPEGGSIWISSRCQGEALAIKVRDDGSGNSPTSGRSNQFGLRSLRERLQAAYGTLANLTVQSGPEGFEAILLIPSPVAQSSEGRTAGGSQ